MASTSGGGGAGGYSGGASPPATASAATSNEAGAMRVVVQRCNSAELLVDEEKDEWTKIGKGLVLYVSFEKGFSAANLPAICKSLLLAPLASADQWSADHSDADCVINLVKAGIEQAVLVMPQASLVCKLERGTKSLKYNKQCGKDEAYELYRSFLRALRSTAEALLDGRDTPDEAAEAEEEPWVFDPEKVKFQEGVERDDEYPEDMEDTKSIHYGGINIFTRWWNHEVKATLSDDKTTLTIYDAEPPSKFDIKNEARKYSTGSWIKTGSSDTKEPRTWRLREDDGSRFFADLAKGRLLIRHGTFGGRQGFKMESSGPLTHTFAF